MRGSFADGQETEPDGTDPDEGFAVQERESSVTGTPGRDDEADPAGEGE